LPELVSIIINGHMHKVASGTVVSAVLLTAGIPCRRSSTGQRRTALCGMGICFECRATVDGVPHRRTCQLLCHAGMVIETQ
jgi:D-hydroxyproline dehydrogenase subunit gamma